MGSSSWSRANSLSVPVQSSCWAWEIGFAAGTGTYLATILFCGVGGLSLGSWLSLQCVNMARKAGDPMFGVVDRWMFQTNLKSVWTQSLNSCSSSHDNSLSCWGVHLQYILGVWLLGSGSYFLGSHYALSPLGFNHTSNMHSSFYRSA